MVRYVERLSLELHSQALRSMDVFDQTGSPVKQSRTVDAVAPAVAEERSREAGRILQGSGKGETRGVQVVDAVSIGAVSVVHAIRESKGSVGQKSKGIAADDGGKRNASANQDDICECPSS